VGGGGGGGAVYVSLNGSTLQFAAKFLDGKDPDEGRSEISDLGKWGIYVKSLEIQSEVRLVAETQHDLESVATSFAGRMVGAS